MAVAAMQKVGILGYREQMGNMISGLQDLGIVHVVPMEIPEESEKGIISRNETLQEQKARKILADLERCRDILKDYLKESWVKPVLNQEELQKIVQTYDVKSIIKKVNEISGHIDDANRKEGAFQRMAFEIKHYLNLDFAPADLDALNDVSNYVGHVPATVVDDLIHDFDEISNLYEFNKLNEVSKNVYFILYAHNEVKDDFLEILRQHEFTPISTELRNQSPQKIFDLFENGKGDVAREIEGYNQELANLAAVEMKNIAILLDYYTQLVEQAEVLSLGETSERAFYLAGWTRERDFEKLSKRLLEKFPYSEIMKLTPGENEQPPVALQNPGWLRPFEILTTMYGKPRRGMIDPTPWTGPFFALFFAFCMTDAGYGLLLAVGSIAFLLFKGKKAAQSVKDFVVLMLYLGVLTIGAGIMAGSYFGWVPPADSMLGKLVLFNALDDAMLFFSISVVFGMVHLVIGYALNGYIAMKEASNGALKVKNLLVALAWVAVTVGISIVITSFLIPEKIDFNEFLMPLATKLILVWAVLLGLAVPFSIVGKKGVMGSIFEAIGFDGLYGITGIFGDILSYARILALGISTGVIAGVINQLGGMIAKGSVVLWVVAAIFVSIGHIGYTLLSTLSAFIHPLRLQFVEYYNKFYESGGRDFVPFRKNYKNIDINSES